MWRVNVFFFCRLSHLHLPEIHEAHAVVELLRDSKLLGRRLLPDEVLNDGGDDAVREHVQDFRNVVVVVNPAVADREREIVSEGVVCARQRQVKKS